MRTTVLAWLEKANYFYFPPGMIHLITHMVFRVHYVIGTFFRAAAIGTAKLMIDEIALKGVIESARVLLQPRSPGESVHILSIIHCFYLKHYCP